MKIIGILIVMLSIVYVPTASAQEVAVKEPFIYNDHGRRDPFWPLVSASGAIISYDEAELSASDMMLTGVMTGSDGRSVAVINGKIVKEGYMIGAFRVDKVTPTFVVLDNGQEKSKLYLRKEK